MFWDLPLTDQFWADVKLKIPRKLWRLIHQTPDLRHYQVVDGKLETLRRDLLDLYTRHSEFCDVEVQIVNVRFSQAVTSRARGND